MKEKSDTAVVVAALEKEAKPLFASIASFAIKDNDSLQVYVNRLKDLKQLKETAETRRRGITDKLNDVVKEINSLFKPFTIKVDIAIENAKSQILLFQEKQEEAKKQLEASFEKGKMKVSKFAEKQAELEVDVKGMASRSSSILVITLPKKIPIQYLMPNEKLILAALKEGKKVPGCKLEMKRSVAL